MFVGSTIEGQQKGKKMRFNGFELNKTVVERHYSEATIDDAEKWAAANDSWDFCLAWLWESGIMPYSFDSRIPHIEKLEKVFNGLLQKERG